MSPAFTNDPSRTSSRAAGLAGGASPSLPRQRTDPERAGACAHPSLLDSPGRSGARLAGAFSGVKESLTAELSGISGGLPFTLSPSGNACRAARAVKLPVLAGAACPGPFPEGVLHVS